MNEGAENQSKKVEGSEDQLEQVIAQGFQATMEYLQNSLPRTSLTKPIHAMNDTGVAPETLGAPVEAFQKIEANAIGGYFMVPIWTAVQNWLRDNPGKFGSFKKENGRRIVKVRSFEEIAAQHQDNSRDLLLDLYRSSTETISMHVSEAVKGYTQMIEQLTSQGTPKEQWPIDARNFARYTTLLPLSEPRREIFDGRPEKQLRLGFTAAEVIIWATIEAIPRLHREQFGKPIPPEELEKRLEKGRSFALYLASLHFDIFRIVGRELLEDEQGNTENLRPFFNENIILISDGKFPFDFKKGWLRKVAKHIQEQPPITETRTGCPAISVRGPDGKNLISELYDSALTIARSYYFPQIFKEVEHKKS